MGASFKAVLGLYRFDCCLFQWCVLWIPFVYQHWSQSTHWNHKRRNYPSLLQSSGQAGWLQVNGFRIIRSVYVWELWNKNRFCYFGLIHIIHSPSCISSFLYSNHSSQRWSCHFGWWDWFRLRGGWDSLWAVNDVPWPQVSAHPVTQHEHLPNWT